MGSPFFSLHLGGVASLSGDGIDQRVDGLVPVAHECHLDFGEGKPDKKTVSDPWRSSAWPFPLGLAKRRYLSDLISMSKPGATR